MNLKGRIAKLESKLNINALPCFCGKTLIDLIYGKPGVDALTHCRNCKDSFDFWEILVREAGEQTRNLTDYEH